MTKQIYAERYKKRLDIEQRIKRHLGEKPSVEAQYDDNSLDPVYLISKRDNCSDIQAQKIFDKLEASVESFVKSEGDKRNLSSKYILESIFEFASRNIPAGNHMRQLIYTLGKERSWKNSRSYQSVRMDMFNDLIMYLTYGNETDTLPSGETDTSPPKKVEAWKHRSNYGVTKALGLATHWFNLLNIELQDQQYLYQGFMSYRKDRYKPSTFLTHHIDVTGYDVSKKGDMTIYS